DAGRDCLLDVDHDCVEVDEPQIGVAGRAVERACEVLVRKREAELVLTDVLEQRSDRTSGHASAAAPRRSTAASAAVSSRATEAASSSGDTIESGTPSPAATNAASSWWNDSSYSRSRRAPEASDRAATSHEPAMLPCVPTALTRNVHAPGEP